MKIESYKTNARIAGALFIITMLAGMIDAYYASPVLHGPLDAVYQSRHRVMTGALLIVLMSAGVVGIAIAVFPVLKRYSESIALTYVSFRIIECVLLVIGAICSFCLVALSQELLKAGVPDASSSHMMGALALKVRYSGYQIAMIILGLGSMMLCSLLFQTRLVPRFLSAWGFIGYALLFISAPLDLLGIIDTINGAGAMLYIPGGIWELVLFPVWLIVKGFNPSAAAYRPADAG